ncbi:hypothetical protein [Phyllobacterium calauticae]|uniref:hypothetical protein n=1 Tax=Phyllobacterium calauticae TaxID=2817027 RepID=UPI001CBDEEDB|nr:hypothetical protein [Phyllobacterium calauticae]MBZ3693405.1 hypothetical protein [Phyllobacterium calauticae]
MTSNHSSRPTKEDWLAAFDHDSALARRPLQQSLMRSKGKTFWDTYWERFEQSLSVARDHLSSPDVVSRFKCDQAVIVAGCFDIDFKSIMPTPLGTFHHPELIAEFRRNLIRKRSIMGLPATATLYGQHHQAILTAVFDGTKPVEQFQKILAKHLASHAGQYRARPLT